MTKCQKDPICGIFFKRGLFKAMKIDIPVCKTHKYKYTNTAYEKVPERPNMWYIFEKRIVEGYEKGYSCVSNAQIQIHKYTNAQSARNMWSGQSRNCPDNPKTVRTIQKLS